MATHPEPVSPVLPSGRRALVTAVVIVATIMVVLDSTIANVALPHMQASLGANSETVAWVLTSYILASAVAIPLTGWLSDRIGRRRLFTGSIVGFTLASMACGVAGTMEAMVAARVVQGLCGAFVAPLGQAIMYDIYPEERHAFAMTIWGLGVMMAQILGPTFGGYLTDRFDWRWVFFINVPIGIAVTLAGWALVTGGARPGRRFDMTGFLLLAIALSAFQLMLDRGTHLDWFQSAEIMVEAGVALGAAWMFLWHVAAARDPIVPMGLFRNSNFATATAMTVILGGVMLAGAALIAPMLQTLLNYPVMLAGMVTMPRGLGTFLAFIVTGKLLSRGVDGRLLIFGGMLGVAASLWMMTAFSLEMDAWPVLLTGFVQGVSMGFMMTPMNLLAFATLAPALRTDGASVYNLARNIGGSIAIALSSALLASNLQVNHAELGASLRLPPLPGLEAAFLQLGLPVQAVIAMLDGEVNRQALMIAYVDDYRAMMWAALLAAPLALLMRRQKAGMKAEPMME